MSGLKAGDRVTIRYSKKLNDNGNNSLINKLGVVTRVVVSGGDIVGAYVDIMVMRRFRNYYIPIDSIDDSDEINKIRVLGLLKTFIF